MLSSVGTDTETMTCTSDDESVYFRSVNSKMQMLRSSIAKNTVIEESGSEDNNEGVPISAKSYKKRLALSETSIWFDEKYFF